MVAMTFLEKYPTTIAIIDANILGSLISTKVPLSLKKTAGNIIAGNTADGT